MSATVSFTPQSFAPLAQWLMLVVDGLKKAFSARAGRDHSLGPLSLLLWNRLGRLTNRFHALLARLEAGQPAPPRRQRATRSARAAPAAGVLRLPRDHFWLFRLLPGDAACYRSHFQAMLADPQTAALLAAAPEAGRILRPLCRLLAITPPGALALPSDVGKPDPQSRPAKPVPVVPLTWAQLIARYPVEDPDPPPRTMDWLRPR